MKILLYGINFTPGADRHMQVHGRDGRAVDNPAALENLRQQALIRFQEAFTWPDVLAQYEALLTRYLPG
ncbi:hypothetical protein [Rhodoferax sp.]|uniref:glycosyltransferase n=1 Tax=Rhodoferax sp. TaxID=50421 RepID=UPI0025EC43B3|nr:hypothetical protein [Rhodoferax sp.]MCM2341473.1 hypothetical protein [Rhodoferax sp.]